MTVWVRRLDVCPPRFRRYVASQATSRELHADRITSGLPLGAELLGRLSDLAKAICRAFLKVSLQEGDHQTVVN
jgi:hypothetical protein